METTFWPRVRAQRAFCEAEILARAAALIVRRPRFAPVLFNPLSALIAASRAFNAALSRAAFNCAPSLRLPERYTPDHWNTVKKDTARHEPLRFWLKS